MTSYLPGHTQKVLYSGSSSETQRVCYGVSQGAVLGPLLLNLYLVSLSSVITTNSLNLHQYTDYCQHLSVPVDDAPSGVSWLSQCIADVAEWLMVPAVCVRHQPWQHCRHAIELETSSWEGHRTRDSSPASSVTAVDTTRDLDLMLDSQLIMSSQVGTVCRSAYNYPLGPISVSFVLLFEWCR